MKKIIMVISLAAIVVSLTALTLLPPPLSYGQLAGEGIHGGGGGGSSAVSYYTITSHTATGNIAEEECVISGINNNSGATETITLTAPQCSAGNLGRPLKFNLTAEQSVVLTPYPGDQFMTLTTASDKTLTSGKTIGTAIYFVCEEVGKWHLKGVNGAWSSN